MKRLFAVALAAGLLSAAIPAGAAPRPLFCCKAGQSGKVTVTQPAVGCCVAGTRGNAGGR